MSLIKNIFGKSSNGTKVAEETTSHINWISLTSIEQIEKIKQLSDNKLVGIFKHSTRCIISKTVLSNFEKSFPELGDQVVMYYLDLLAYREISNELSYTFQVQHQSPQLLLIRNREVVAHASHYDITQLNVEKFVK